jgi:hypothetical protein
MPADIPKAPGEVTTTFFDPAANAKAQAQHDADQAATQANIDKYNAEQAAAAQAQVDANVAENKRNSDAAVAAQNALWEQTKQKYGDVYDPNFNANILKNAVNYSTTDEQAAAKQQADLNAMVQSQQAQDAAALTKAENASMPSADQQAAVQEATDRYNKVVADIAAGNPNPTQEPGYTSSGMYGQDSTPVNPDGGSTGDYGKNMYTTGGYQFGPQVGKNEVTGLSSYDQMMQGLSSGGGAPVQPPAVSQDSSKQADYMAAHQSSLTSMPGASPPPGYGSEAFTNYYTSPRNTAPGPEVLVKFIRQFIR